MISVVLFIEFEALLGGLKKKTGINTLAKNEGGASISADRQVH